MRPYSPSLSPLAFGHLPLTRGVGPWTPFYGGRQCGRQSVNAKARVAQLNGLHSIAAAAEWSVTFGDCSDRWKARLLA